MPIPTSSATAEAARTIAGTATAVPAAGVAMEIVLVEPGAAGEAPTPSPAVHR